MPNDFPILAKNVSKNFILPPDDCCWELQWTGFHFKREFTADALKIALKGARAVECGLYVRQYILCAEVLDQSRARDQLRGLIHCTAQQKCFAGSVQPVGKLFQRMDAGRIESRHVPQAQNHNIVKLVEIPGSFHELFGGPEEKIDRSLVSRELGGVKSRAIVRAISALGQSLGISTLAEGVESSEQLAQVRSDGCQSVQGFYYSEAVPSSAVLDLLSTVSQSSAKEETASRGEA